MNIKNILKRIVINTVVVITFGLFCSYTISDVKYNARYVKTLNYTPGVSTGYPIFSHFHKDSFAVILQTHNSIDLTNYNMPVSYLQSYLSNWETNNHPLHIKAWDNQVTSSAIRDKESLWPEENVNLLGISDGVNHTEIFNDYTPGTTDDNGLLAYTLQYVIEDYPDANGNLAPACSLWFGKVIIGFDIILNGYAPFERMDLYFGNGNSDWNKKVDVVYTIMHEVGHGLGLDHHPQGANSDLMNASLAPGAQFVALSGLDIWAIENLYNPNQYPRTSNIPCSLFYVPTSRAAGGGLQSKAPGCNSSRTVNCNWGFTTNVGCLQSESAPISPVATTNIIEFNQANFSGVGNVNSLIYTAAFNHEVLTEIMVSESPEYDNFDATLNEFSQNFTPIVEQTFCCEESNEEELPILTEYDILLAQQMLTEIENVTENEMILYEVSHLLEIIPSFVGKNLKQASLHYESIRYPAYIQ